VTYLHPRIESRAGMICLVSRVPYARAAPTGWPKSLRAASVAAAAAAMASKENAVVLPLLVLAYDWFFVAESPRDWLQGLWRRRVYVALLAATWLLVAGQLLFLGGKYQEFQEQKHAPLYYALTQAGVILHYVRLAILPVGQQFDYSNWPVATSAWQVLPALTVVLVALAVTAVGTILRRPWAWPAVLFFLALAPTSSIMPIEAVANEHRMYVALAGVVVLVVLGLVAAADWIAARRPGWLPGDPRLPAAAAAVVLLLLVLATQFRNQLYSKVGGIWLDVLAKAPDNYRANWMVASIFDCAGETEIGVQFAERSVEHRPTSPVFSDLVHFHSMKGDHAGAERICRRGLELQRARLAADDAAVLCTTADLGAVLARQRKLDDAETLCAASIDAMRRVLGATDPATLSCERILAEAAARRPSDAAAGSPPAP
ncbi:MAG: tetratricopeptide repeat protein, partial [Planctomycetia bacterium]